MGEKEKEKKDKEKEKEKATVRSAPDGSDKNGVHRTTARSVKLSLNAKCKMQRNSEKCREML